MFFFICRVATGNPVVFTLQPPECYMEIRSGYGVSGARVSGPVRVGDPLTLLIYMRSAYGEYLNVFIYFVFTFSFCFKSVDNHNSRVFT